MNKHYQQVTPAPVINKSNDKEFLHTFTAGAMLPLVQASITALIIGVSVLVIEVYMFDALDPFRVTIPATVIAWVATWLISVRRWFTLTNIERVVNLDINHDGQIGETKRAPVKVVRVQIDRIRENGHIQQQSIIDLPIGEQELTTLARGLMNHIPFSEKRWTGEGNLFSIDEFRALRSELIRRELLTLANEKDRRQGYTLTEAGRALMQQMAASPTPAQDEE